MPTVRTLSRPAPRIVPAADTAVTTTHNQPPVDLANPLAIAKSAFEEVRTFLKETPVIQTEADAKQASGYLERTRIALKDARDARDAKTRPFLDRLTAIRDAFEIVREKTKTNPGGVLEQAASALRARLTKYADAIEAQRIAELARKQQEAEEAERKARAAEAAEQEAIANAEAGECTDVAGAIAEADQSFNTFKRADRAVQVAARSVPVRFTSMVGGRAQTMRTTEVLSIATLDDAMLALRAMGLTDKVREALLSSARDYRKAHEELPAGITQTHQRSM